MHTRRQSHLNAYLHLSSFDAHFPISICVHTLNSRKKANMHEQIHTCKHVRMQACTLPRTHPTMHGHFQLVTLARTQYYWHARTLSWMHRETGRTDVEKHSGMYVFTLVCKLKALTVVSTNAFGQALLLLQRFCARTLEMHFYPRNAFGSTLACRHER